MQAPDRRETPDKGEPRKSPVAVFPDQTEQGRRGRNQQEGLLLRTRGRTQTPSRKRGRRPPAQGHQSRRLEPLASQTGPFSGHGPG